MSLGSERRPGELVFAAILLIFSLVAFWQAYKISGFSGLSTPGVFPMLATGTMIVAALFNLVRTARLPAPDARAGPVTAQFLREVMPFRHVVIFAMVLLYLLALPWLGFVVSSGLFLLAAFQFLWRKSPTVSLVLTAATLAAIYIIFRLVFQVVLPQGSLMRGLF